MRTLIQQGTPDQIPAPVGKRVASGFAAVAALCSVVPLLGWLLEIPALRGLGFEHLPIWPYTALGYLSLSIGFIVAPGVDKRRQRIFWAIPIAIAGIATMETVAGVDLGIDRLLIGDIVLGFPAAHPGRPGVGPCLTLTLLALAGYASGEQRWLRDEVGSLLASAVLALGAAAVVLVLLSMGDANSTRPFNSLPGSIAAISLALAFIIRNADFGWVRLLSQRTDWPTLRLLTPLVLLLPLFPSLLAILIVPAGSQLNVNGQIAIVIGNILIVALVAYGALIRVARGQAATIELAQALDSTTVALTAPDGTILNWSRGCEQLYGWSAAEAVGRNKYALMRARCEQQGVAGLPRASAPDTQALIEVRRDGSEVSVLERTHQVETPGRAPLLVLSITDVSETAAAMAALRESEDRLAEAAASHELGIFEWDVATGRFHWSPGTEQRLGVVPGTLDDFESWRAQIYPEDLEAILDTLAEAVANREEKFRYRYRFLQPNGGVRAVEGSSRAFYDLDGNLVRTIGVIVDVSEREEREAALIGREAQLRSILETVPDPMIVVDEHGLIREISAAAVALWGYPLDEMLGRHLSIITTEAERERHWGAIARAMLNRDERLLGRVLTGIGLTASGREFPLEYRVGLAGTDDRTLYTIFFRDLSERLATEERMSELSTELAHVSRQSAMSELAADIAHELNQPLSATSNFLAAARMLIDKGEEAGRVAELLRMGGEQTLRAGEIIRRMRDFTARHEVEMRVESVEQTVRDAAELVLVGTGQFHIRMTYDLDPAARKMFADRIQVQQVLVNLLRNAMQALRPLPANRREIIVTSRKVEGNMIEIMVSDTGNGIPEAVLGEIFTRFTTTKGSKGGMGIGLSISKRIVEAHGGTLSAENRAEGGASFRLTVPAVGEGEDE